jgi:hypothetical protein
MREIGSKEMKRKQLVTIRMLIIVMCLAFGFVGCNSRQTHTKNDLAELILEDAKRIAEEGRENVEVYGRLIVKDAWVNIQEHLPFSYEIYDDKGEISSYSTGYALNGELTCKSIYEGENAKEVEFQHSPLRISIYPDKNVLYYWLDAFYSLYGNL